MLEHILWIFFSGITLGCIYAFVALGFTIVYSMTRLFNLLAGEFVMVSALVASTLYGAGFSLLLSIALALIITCAVGAITWMLFLHHSYSTRASDLTLLLIIATLAIAAHNSGH